jgi:DNA-binding response OmpR family regulator
MAVDGVVTVESAEATIAQREYHVVLVDRHIGDGDGLELMERLRERHPDLGMLLVSGDITPEVETRAQELGVHCLRKPFQHDRLVALVQLAGGRSATIQLEDALDCVDGRAASSDE